MAKEKIEAASGSGKKVDEKAKDKAAKKDKKADSKALDLSGAPTPTTPAKPTAASPGLGRQATTAPKANAAAEGSVDDSASVVVSVPVVDLHLYL